MATSTSTIDPVSRIEGHLRVEMEVEDGVIKNAWTSAGLFRGMELILENRAPHDAVSIVQRIVEHLGWRMTVHSSQQGCRFSLEWPA